MYDSREDGKAVIEKDKNGPELRVGRDAFRFCYSLESVRLPLEVTFETNTVFEDSPFQKVYEGLYGPVEM